MDFVNPFKKNLYIIIYAKVKAPAQRKNFAKLVLFGSNDLEKFAFDLEQGYTLVIYAIHVSF